MMHEDEYDEEYEEYLRFQSRYENDPGPNGRNSRDSDDEEWEESVYNTGKGIKYTIKFQPQLPPPQAGEKRRKNAKADPITRHIHLHEKSTFAQVLDHIISAIDRDDRSMKYKIVAKELRTTRFKITWSIARTENKNMQLSKEKDYSDLIDECAELKNVSKVIVSLAVTENELETATTPDGDEDEPGEKSKRRKFTEEEEEMAETILQLQGANRCSDRTCSGRWCFVGNATAKHVRLTPLLLKIWASAMLAKMPGVDSGTPPPADEEKAFWPLADQPDDIDDIALLASRRRASASKPSSSVTINNDFAGLAAIFQPFFPNKDPGPIPPTTPHRLPRTLPIASPAKPANMTIPEFCAAFRLSDDILQRLTQLQLDGPHLLEYLENSVLDQYLQLGQRASVRFAEAEWKKGKVGL